jgi:transposase
VQHHSEAFIGIDTSKLKNAIAIAEGGRDGEVRYWGEIDASEAATRKLVAKLAAKYDKLTFCYEAGPTGYGLQRLIDRLGHPCAVVAPSLIPRKAGDRVKTNRRDALGLARLLRAGELTAVWVPDEQHEAMRDLSRAREAAMEDLKAKRQQISSLLLRHGLHYPGKKTWGRKHRTWLAQLKLAHHGTRLAFAELMAAEGETQARVDRLAAAIREAVPEWSLGPVATALMAMRGVDLITAVVVLAEIGDLSRFRGARDLMGYLGLVPSENSTGDSVRRGGITKAGNRRVRRVLIESAWSYRYPARVSPAMQARVAAAPEPARKIAWKAQTRLSARYRALIKNGKLPTVAVTAVAREMAGFIWDICRTVTPNAVAAGAGGGGGGDASGRGGPRPIPACRRARGRQGQALRAAASGRP